MLQLFGKLDWLIGMSFDFMLNSGKEPHEIIEEIRSGAENKIREIDRSLY